MPVAMVPFLIEGDEGRVVESRENSKARGEKGREKKLRGKSQEGRVRKGERTTKMRVKRRV